MDKFGRNYNLEIELSDGDTLFLGPPETDLFTIEFDVTRSNLAQLNTCTVRIYNLSRSNRKKIFRDWDTNNNFRKLRLKAGYGQVLPSIFFGNINSAYSQREGANYITTIECQDGLESVSQATFDKSYQANGVLTKSDILSDILDTMTARGDVTKGLIGRNFDEIVARGQSLSGNSAFLADQLSGGGFFVDNQKAYILADNEAILGALNTITSESGLLNTPRIERKIIHFDMLFEPRLIIGQLLNLQSLVDDSFNGVFKVTGLEHHGMISNTICGDVVTRVNVWGGTGALQVQT